MRTVSLMTANQEFSRLLRKVERGESFLITRRGRPVDRDAGERHKQAREIAGQAVQRD